MFLKRIARWFVDDVLPYKASVVINTLRNKTPDFIKDYDLWSLNHKRIEFDETSKFTTIVSVQGFGFSGSGAIVDLLREFDECLVFGGKDEESGRNVDNAFEEMDFMRLSGGLLELESYLTTNNVFIKDQYVHRFIKMISSTRLYQCNDRFREIVYSFFSQIIELRIRNIKGCPYNRGLSKWNFYSEIYFIKDLTIEEYRNLCRRMLNTLFNDFCTNKKSKIVLDQFYTDFNFRKDVYESYTPNLKNIVVYRDPRDVYTYAKLKNIDWIPHDNVKDFVEWNKIMYRNFNPKSSDYYAIRLEDLILNYSDSVSKLSNYLSLANHDHPKNCFIPEVSCKNIGLWKTMPSYQEDYNFIAEELYVYCVNSLPTR